MSPGDRVEEDSEIPTSNQRDETKIWPLVISFSFLRLQVSSVTLRPQSPQLPNSFSHHDVFGLHEAEY